MVDCLPFSQPGSNPTCLTSADVVGCRFAKVSTGVNEVGGLAQVAHCGAGLRPYGVTARDKLAGEAVMLYREGEVPVTAGAALSHGQAVMSDANGKAIPFVATNAAAASAVTGIVGNNNALRHTAKGAGASGNAITIQILGSTGASVPLSVAVVGNAITVTPATNGGSAITSTATLVAAAIAASAPAAALILSTNEGASSGAGVVVAEGPTALAGGADPGYVVRAGVCLADAAIDTLAHIGLELGA